ncbi:MAG: DUF929 family protein [Ktedonobacterales bacterium]
MAKSKHTQHPPAARRSGATGNGSTQPSARAAGAAPPNGRASSTLTARQPGRANGATTATGSARSLAARRPGAQSAGQRRRQPQGWAQRLGGISRGVWISLGAVVLVVVLFVVIGNLNQQSTTRQPVPAAVLQQVTRVSPSVLAQVGTGGQDVPFKATPKGTAVLTSNGKPVFTYVGAEYCPHCAAERWAVVVALSRFGTFSNLHLIKSISTDTPANIPSFTFYKSTYTSQYLTFSTVETEDRSGATLEQPTAQQKQLFAAYDVPPYATTANSIPFLDIGNQYIQVGEGFPSTLLATATWQSIASALGTPSTPEAQAILGNANYLTAAFCKLTNNQPASVCTAAPIPAIEQKLPQAS